MALIVEDGTGLSTAQSYLSVADAATLLAARGDATWAASTDALREAALVRATRYIDSRRFRGYRATSAQALAWPRLEVTDDDGYVVEGIPAKLKAALAEAALLELGTVGVLAPALERGGMVVEETVGPLTTKYAAGAQVSTRYTVIDRLLSVLVESGGLRISR